MRILQRTFEKVCGSLLDAFYILTYLLRYGSLFFPPLPSLSLLLALARRVTLNISPRRKTCLVFSKQILGGSRCACRCDSNSVDDLSWKNWKGACS
jgi:hypothetical protein